MLTSALVLMTLLPMQISPSGRVPVFLSKPLAVAAFIDSAKILGLPKFRLRDSNGNLYLPDKVLLQEPLAIIYANADIVISEAALSQRKKYIASYVRR